TPPPRARIDESMEALIHHFKLFTEGFKVPPGETYVAIESPRGEIGCYMVSDGSGKPVRMHIRGPSFYNLQAIDPMGDDSLDADVTVEEVECLAACGGAPALQVNYEFHENMTEAAADALVEEYRSGKRKARTISGASVG